MKTETLAKGILIQDRIKTYEAFKLGYDKYHDQPGVNYCNAKIDKLREQLAELQDEPEIVQSERGEYDPTNPYEKELQRRIAEREIFNIIVNYQIESQKRVLGIEIVSFGKGCGEVQIGVNILTN